jgi:hypothetical protein
MNLKETDSERGRRMETVQDRAQRRTLVLSLLILAIKLQEC